MGKHKWTEDEIEFLIKEYPSKTRHYCSSILGIPVEQIVYKVRQLKLKKNKSLNSDEFINIKSPYMSYILGFLWSDGHVRDDGRHFSIGGVVQDMEEIKPLLFHFGNWGEIFQDRKKNGWKNAKYFIGSNPDIHNFFCQNDYREKSVKSADKILSKIPDNLKHYFFRGIVDGDGSFYYKNNGRQFAITSSYNQDWAYFETLCKELGIKYTIKRVININKKTQKENKSSVLRILGKEIIKLGDYLYNGELFGLSRKLNKYQEIKRSYDTKRHSKGIQS